MSCNTIKTDFNEFPETLDPFEPIGKTYTIPIQVLAGDAVTGATLTEVEKGTDTPVISPKITISEKAIGVIEPLLDGVSFRAQGRSLFGKAYVRCEYTTTLGNGDAVNVIMKIGLR